jgi:3-hydroxyisobutyrate dehydrogenase-like beta-hydroxyacid dehydrogenase
MARRLLGAGHEVAVWNRTRAKGEALADEGARVASTPAEAADAEVVITMLRDADALRSVAAGAIEGLSRGATWVEMSTVGPEAITELAGAMPSHATLVDAPVLGSLAEAEDGSLRIFVGGDRAAFDRVRPVLLALGDPLHVGPQGSGAAAKLVANSTLFAVVTALGEAVALGRALGLELDRIFDVLAGTPLAAQAERRRDAIEGAEQPTRFALSLAVKDADLVVNAAESRGVDLRIAAAAQTWLERAERGGWGDHDYSAVTRWIAEQAASPGRL